MKKSSLIAGVFALLSLTIHAQSNVLVLEYKGEEHTTRHGVEVSAIACDSREKPCYVEYTSSFSDEAFAESINESLNDSFVVNMSFSIFAPQAPIRDIRDIINGNTDKYENDLKKYEDALETFKTEKLFLGDLLQNNPEKLFVIAAGNGFALEAMVIPGVVVSEKYPLYPSLMNFDNTLKVAALEQEQINFKNLNDHNLAFYSNYSVKNVDIAAPVPFNTKGEVQRGTSFSAPWVSSQVAKLKDLYPRLTSKEAKELVMKSAYIPNIKKALVASLDEQELGMESLLYKAQHESNVAKRKEFLEQLGNDVYLIKSGGFLHPELLFECARNYRKKLRYTIELACLQAHKSILKRSTEELNDLVALWNLRGI